MNDRTLPGRRAERMARHLATLGTKTSKTNAELAADLEWSTDNARVAIRELEAKGLIERVAVNPSSRLIVRRTHPFWAYIALEEVSA